MMIDRAILYLVAKTVKYLFFFLISTAQLFCQSSDFEDSIAKCVDNLRVYNISNFESDLVKINPKNEIDFAVFDAIKWKHSFLLKSKSINFPKDKIKLFEESSDFSTAIFYLFYADYINSIGADETFVYEVLIKVKSISTALNNPKLICEVLKRMIDMINYKQEDYDLLVDLTDEYQFNAYDSFEKDLSLLYKTRALSAMNQLPYIEEFLEGKRKAIRNGNKVLIPYYDKLLGVKYEVYTDYLKANMVSLNNYQKSLEHYNFSISGYSNYLPENWAEKRLIGLFINIGINYHFQKKMDSANYYLNKAKGMISNTISYDYILVAKWKGENFKLMGESDSAYFYKNKEVKLRRADYSRKTDVSISEISTKYQTAEKEKQILEEQQRTVTNRNWLIAAILALVIGGGMAVLLQKNTTKKRQLAEQTTLLEQQKVETLLKEQELVSIDAMIEGQEKERTKVANELHDDLGSLMATVKLHFDNVKVNQKDPALLNAQKLLDEAYQKIRGMAHAKNSGVMANQGLLPAIEKMVKTINETNALELTVEDFGLGERMENSLELTIFRILQELVANIIKHSQATKASIQLTQHEDNMNIIVEDNGRGFDMSVVKRNENGMGLGSIEKRIEHLEGTFTVDSIEGKGTSILIDIPI